MAEGTRQHVAESIASLKEDNRQFKEDGKQMWAHYKQCELERMIDSSLTDDLEIKEACKTLKVGLLCTQEASKLRPSMSIVVKILTGEKDIDLERITQPGLVSDLMQKKMTDQLN